MSAEKIIASGKTIDEAVKNGLTQFGLAEDQVRVRVLEQPSKGFLGLIGAKDARVELELIVPAAKISGIAVVSETQAEGPSTEAASASSAEKSDAEEETVRFLEDVFQAMGIEVDLSKVMSKDSVVINLSGSEMGILIGRRGQTLDALQYLTNIVYNRHTKSHTKIILDAENFRDRRRQTLEELADRLARKVVKTRKEVVLEPMSPQERKIIHSKLQDHRYVKTYSKGEEPNRRVVIALK